MITYFVVNYFDCWYSEDEGWTVNNSCPEDDMVLPDDWDNNLLISNLIERNLLKPEAREKVEVDEYGEGFEVIDKETQMPLFGFTVKYTR